MSQNSTIKLWKFEITALGHSKPINLSDKTLYFPLNFHFRITYNPNKLKQILPVKSYYSIDCVINGVIDSSIPPDISQNVSKYLSCNGEKTAEMR